jgi:glycosyltransferase involved in cell wall biosynthesis
MKNRVCQAMNLKKFVHVGYHLCFVNDGSKDKTLEVLQELRKGKEEYISTTKKNGGKAEAVRLGMLHLAKANAPDISVSRCRFVH